MPAAISYSLLLPNLLSVAPTQGLPHTQGEIILGSKNYSTASELLVNSNLPLLFNITSTSIDQPNRLPFNSNAKIKLKTY